MQKKNKGVSKGALAMVGMAAATAAGAFWLFGSKHAAKHRKIAKSWMLKARGEVLESVEKAVEKAGQIDKNTYSEIVEKVLARYSKIAGVTSAEIASVTRDMKAGWQHMQKAHAKTKPKAKKVSKKKAK